MFGVLFWLCVLMIGYVYVGYPALLTLIARLFPHPLRCADITPTVTLLIAAYNEEAVIADKLENCLALDYPAEKLQVLVAADGSTDRTVEIVRSFAGRGVELCYDAVRGGKMAAINHAMSLARGEIVVFSDANNFYQREALRALVRPFADPTVGAASGAKHIVKGDGQLGEAEGLYWKYESFIKKQEALLWTCTAAAGEIFAVRGELFVPAPPEVINDDFYLALQVIRRGFRVVYVPTAISLERVSLSAQDEIVRRTRIVAGRYQAMAMSLQWLPFRQPLVVWQVLSHKFLRPLVPFAMIAALVSNLLAWLFPPTAAPVLVWLSGFYAPLMFALQVLFYGMAWLGAHLPGQGWLANLFYLPTFLVNSNFAALLGFLKYVRGEQSAAWKRAERRHLPIEIDDHPLS
jgi:cellulose synthase/poly-beta-1,6-N-acetylglucosamine synthase-like glycosyltransferase